MMSAISPIKGVDQSLAFLDLVLNAAARKAELEKIEKARVEANKAIAKAGKAKEIEGLHAKATESVQAAERKIAEADVYVEETMRAAERDAAAVKAKTDQYSSDKHAKLKNWEADLTGREADTQARLTKVVEREAAVKEAEARVGEESAAMNTARETYEARTARLDNALSEARA